MKEPRNRARHTLHALDEGTLIGLTESEMLGLFGAALAEEASRHFLQPAGEPALTGTTVEMSATPSGDAGGCRIIPFPQKRW